MFTSQRVRKGSRRKRKMRIYASVDSKYWRGSFESDKPSVEILVRRSDGPVEFLVRKNLQDGDEEIAANGDETVILCTDDDTIDEDIDEYDGIDTVGQSIS
jgi:hypothetical protein